MKAVALKRRQATGPLQFIENIVELLLDREPWAGIAGLVCGWTALFAAIWFAVLFAIVGAIGGFFITGFMTLGIGQASQGTALLGSLTGMAYGFVAGFYIVFGSAFSLHVILSLIVGVVVAFAVTFAIYFFEPTLLGFRGYRRPSCRAEEAKLLDMLGPVASHMGLRDVPAIRISDNPIPGAWAHMRHTFSARDFSNS